MRGEIPIEKAPLLIALGDEGSWWQRNRSAPSMRSTAIGYVELIRRLRTIQRPRFSLRDLETLGLLHDQIIAIAYKATHKLMLESVEARPFAICSDSDEASGRYMNWCGDCLERYARTSELRDNVLDQWLTATRAYCSRDIRVADLDATLVSTSAAVPSHLSFHFPWEMLVAMADIKADEPAHDLPVPDFDLPPQFFYLEQAAQIASEIVFELQNSVECLIEDTLTEGPLVDAEEVAAVRWSTNIAELERSWQRQRLYARFAGLPCERVEAVDFEYFFGHAGRLSKTWLIGKHPR